MKVVALPGSLRAESSNKALLRAAAALAPPGMEVVLEEGARDLPLFDPDLDLETSIAPPAVAAFRARLAAADAFLISSPEYAHGVPGAFKNALDWLVSSGELVDKPVVLLNAAPLGGERAQASLVDTLQVMSARVLVEASRVTPFVRQRIGAGGVLDDDARALVRAGLDAIAAAVRASS